MVRIDAWQTRSFDRPTRANGRIRSRACSIARAGWGRALPGLGFAPGRTCSPCVQESAMCRSGRSAVPISDLGGAKAPKLPSATTSPRRWSSIGAGIDGATAAEPLLARAAVAPGTTEAFKFLCQAGTFMCDLALLGDGAEWPTRALPLVVSESEAVAVDRDEVILVEDWRLRPDGSATTPGIDPQDLAPAHTINGLTTRISQCGPTNGSDFAS